MNVERAKWIIIALLFFLDVAVFYVGYRVGEAQHSQAIEECTEDLLKNCKNLYDYAASLEDENSRLNRLYSDCKN